MYAGPLHRHTATVFGSGELECLGIQSERARNEREHFHGILVFLVDREMQIRASEFLPVGSATIACVSTTTTSTLVAFVAIRGRGDPHHSFAVCRRLELGVENAPDRLVHLDSLIAVCHDRGRDFSEFARSAS